MTLWAKLILVGFGLTGVGVGLAIWFGQAGELRDLGKPENGWTSFKAKQYFTLRSPGFVWDARIRMASLMQVRVRDAYVAGQGSAQVSILSFITFADRKVFGLEG